MLQLFIVQAASGILHNIQYTDRALVPVPGTPVADMVKTLTAFNECGSDDELVHMSVTPCSTEGIYDDVKDELTAKISRIMGNIISAAKNLVNPHCRSILKRIEDGREYDRVSRGKLDVNIVQIDVPPLLADETFLMLIDPFKNTTLMMPDKMGATLFSLNNYFTPDEIKILLQTGSATLDTRISAYVAGDYSLFNNLENAANISELDLRSAVLFFILLTGIKNGRLDKADGLTNNVKLNADLATLRALLGRKIYMDMARMDQDVKTGNLIAYGRYVPCLSNAVIPVLGKNYRDWIKTNGGSPEAMLGYYIDGGFKKVIMNNANLVQDPQYYVDIYNRHLTYIKSLTTLNDRNLVKQTITDYMQDLIRKMPEDTDKVALQNRLNKALEEEYFGNDSLHKFVIKVVCAVLTEGDSVCKLLLNIDSILADMETPDMTYAIYIGTIKLIAGWLATQTTVH